MVNTCSVVIIGSIELFPFSSNSSIAFSAASRHAPMSSAPDSPPLISSLAKYGICEKERMIENCCRCVSRRFLFLRLKNGFSFKRFHQVASLTSIFFAHAFFSPIFKIFSLLALSGTPT